jgi:hypothetical protein
MKVANGFRLALIAVLAGACGGDETSTPPTQTGQTCMVAAQCYPGVADSGALRGEVTCMTKVPDGYCTHTCTADTDCCAVDGECVASHGEVCSPFESTDMKYCLLSCEDAALKAAGATDADSYCAKYANAKFTCRSSGGGSENRKICSP